LQRTIAIAVLAIWIAAVTMQNDSAAKIGIIMCKLVTQGSDTDVTRGCGARSFE
jgi:hypothetical protein